MICPFFPRVSCVVCLLNALWVFEVAVRVQIYEAKSVFKKSHA